MRVVDRAVAKRWQREVVGLTAIAVLDGVEMRAVLLVSGRDERIGLQHKMRVPVNGELKVQSGLRQARAGRLPIPYRAVVPEVFVCPGAMRESREISEPWKSGFRYL